MTINEGLADDRESSRASAAVSAAVKVSGIDRADVDERTEPEFAFALWWNTTIQWVMNGTTGTLLVLNQESQDSLRLGPGGRGLVRWYLPWCNTYDEVASKSITFRALTPGQTGMGVRLFSIFQDYRSETAMWLPSGVTDFAMRAPIEVVASSGNFLPSAVVINLRPTVLPTGQIVPVADNVVPRT
jgi:hypothetical protein